MSVKAFRRTRVSLAVAAISMGGAAAAQAGFVEETVSNPFDAITSTGDRPSLVMMDMDADGDLDAVIFHANQDDPYPFDGYDGSSYGGGTSIWENIGSASAAEFGHVPDYAGVAEYGGDGENIDVNPFASDYQEYYGHPVSAFDMDDDGDLDLFGGHRNIYSYEQMLFGRVQSDGQGVVTGVDTFDRYDGYGGENPFYGASFVPSAYAGYYGAAFAAGDLDNDGDVDIVANDYDTLRVFMNDGTDQPDVIPFNELASLNNPFYGATAGGGETILSVEYRGAPIVLHDVDGDGDLDLVMGTVEAGDLRLFENIGSAGTADFQEVVDTSGSIDVASTGWAAPTFADIDGDGDSDLIVMELTQAPVEARIAVRESDQAIRLFINDTPQSGDSTTPASFGSGDSSGLFGGLGLGGLLVTAFGLLFRRRR